MKLSFASFFKNRFFVQTKATDNQGGIYVVNLSNWIGLEYAYFSHWKMKWKKLSLLVNKNIEGLRFPEKWRLLSIFGLF